MKITSEMVERALVAHQNAKAQRDMGKSAMRLALEAALADELDIEHLAAEWERDAREVRKTRHVHCRYAIAARLEACAAALRTQRKEEQP